MPDDPALRIFPDEFVPNIQGAPYHAKWEAANKTGDAPKWRAFRDSLIAGGAPPVPSMATKYGRALIAAGKEHMTISHLLGAPVNPFPPGSGVDLQPPSVPTGAIGTITDTSIQLNWSPSSDNVGVQHYNLFLGNGASVASQTQVDTSTGVSYTFTGLAAGTDYSVGIEAEDAAGNKSSLSQAIWWPVTTTGAPVGGGTTIDSIADLNAIFRPDWTQPPQSGASQGSGGAFNVSTPYGNGIRFVCTADMPAPWDPVANKVLLAHWLHNVQGPGSVLGHTDRWDMNVYLPTQTIPNDWQAGTIWEYHTNASSGHNLAMYSNGTWRPVRQIAPGAGGGSYQFYQGPAIAFNTWIPLRFEIKWSYSNDGYFKLFIDGVDYVNAVNVPTLFDSGLPYLQFGWYAAKQQTNEITFGPIQLTRLS